MRFGAGPGGNRAHHGEGGGARYAVLALFAVAVAMLALSSVAPALADVTAYRANDYGNVLNILPAGAAGNATALQAAPWLPMSPLTKTYPPHFQDQYDMYQNLLYATPGLQDSALTKYYKDASFGVQPGQVESIETLTTADGNVTIIRDKQFGVPHIYGDTVQAMAYGAGYATGEDRLFLIDVLRHYGSGHLSELVGPSCGNQQMDHDQLQLTGYTQQDKDNQLAHIDSLGAIGHEGRTMIHSYVGGINQFIGDLSNPLSSKFGQMPVEYPLATGSPVPGAWKDSDIIDIASLVGGIFGKGGGDEVASGHLLQFLQTKFPGNSGQDALAMFRDFHEVNDPNAPTVVTDKSFPYELQGPVSSKNAFTDPAAAVTDPSPGAVHPDCEGYVSFLQNFHLPTVLSNALLVDAKHSASGRPIAVMGPQVGYYAPQILQEVDLHAPDYDARGASFPGTSFIVELGRGQDYAWSATSADTDVVDQRLLEMCPNQGTAPDNKYYKLNGACVKMDYHDDVETALTKPGGMGVIITLHHAIYRNNPADPVQGVVLGFTKTPGAQPIDVAIVSQRSTYQHELDSAEGFLRWQHPSLTHDAQSWQEGAAKIGYTFNWFYADNQDIAYYVSGHDPIRPSNLDATLPTWGGRADTNWTGFLADNAHPNEINPPQGFLSSWNNKPAPQFGASDATYGFGPIFRQRTLADNITQQFALHNNQITRANLVDAMEQGASVDLTGARVEPELEAYLASAGLSLDPATTGAMMTHLHGWVANGAHRIRAQHGDAEYNDASGVATMDELNPKLISAVFNSVFCANPASCTPAEEFSIRGLPAGYNKLPMGFTDLPSGRNGSSYDGGWEGYMWKVLRQLRGAAVAQPFSAEMMSHVCTGGAAACPGKILQAITDTYNAMKTANGGSANVGGWTKNDNLVFCASNSCPTQMPAYDNISFTVAGLISQPDMDWQNRPTFQQVVDFPSHRARNTGTQATVVSDAATGSLPNTGAQRDVSAAALAGLAGAIAVVGIGRRRRRRKRAGVSA
ncbi:MAG: penicillin acylase family protein [Candidatus Dormiibacterota bacterium]